MPSNISDVFPLTVTVPGSFEDKAIMEVIDPYASVQAAYVERESVYEVPETWRNACGFYILFSPISKDGSYKVYVGKSDKDFTKRLRSHDQNKEGWVTALLVQRVSVGGLSSTQSSYLEGALRDIFDRASHVTCHNIAKTGDWTLPDHEKLLMKQVIDSTLRIMLLRGYRTKAPSNAQKTNELRLIDASTSEASILATTPSSKMTPPPAPNLTMSVPSVSRPIASPTTKESLPSASPIAAPQNSSIPPESKSVAAPTTEKKSSRFSLFRKSSPVEPLSSKPHDPEEVFQVLRAWRIQKAREQGISPGYVFDDYVLRALVEKMPADFDALLTIAGIKEVKRAKYGNDILQVLSEYR